MYLLDGLGMAPACGSMAIAEASRAIEPHVGHPLPSRVFRAMQATRAARHRNRTVPVTYRRSSPTAQDIDDVVHELE